MMTQRSRGEPPRRLGRGVVGGQSGVGERGDIGRFQRLVDLHDAARRRLEVLGVAAVGVDAGKRVGLAVRIVTRPAGPAQPAGDQRVDDDLVAFLDIGDRRSDRIRPAGVLVPDRVRQLNLRLLGPLALQDMQIGPAHTGSADLDDDVERSGRRRDRFLLHLEVLVVADHLDGSHGAHSSAPFGTVRADTGTKVESSSGYRVRSRPPQKCASTVDGDPGRPGPAQPHRRRRRRSCCPRDRPSPKRLAQWIIRGIRGVEQRSGGRVVG